MSARSDHRRLSRLEAAATKSPADRGSHCRDCGGLSIEDLAYLMRDEPDERPEIDVALALGADRYLRCGGLTLVGALAEDAVE